jgi:hypothetical protein
MFVVDEVGQFVARDVQKMLDLQAVVQNLGVKGRGKHWVVVTSQEKLGELVTRVCGRGLHAVISINESQHTEFRTGWNSIGLA